MSEENVTTGGEAAEIDSTATTTTETTKTGAEVGNTDTATAETTTTTTEEKTVVPDWPEDWRVKIAGDDTKRLKNLEKFATPTDMEKAYNALQAKISKGELKKEVAKPEDPEQVKAWRAERGIPESPDKYNMDLPDGLVVGEDYKPQLEGILKVAHANDIPEAQIKPIIAEYLRMQVEKEADMADADVDFREEARAELTQTWGAETRKNMALANQFIKNTFGEELSEQMLSARLPNEQALGSNPAFLKALVSLAREIDPVGSVVPHSQKPMQAMEGEIAEIEAKMGTDAYTAKDRERLQVLYEARNKVA